MTAVDTPRTSIDGVLVHAVDPSEKSALESLRYRLKERLQLRFALQHHHACLRSVERSEDAGILQLVDDARGAGIADLEATLQERDRSLLMPHDQVCRFIEQIVATTAAARASGVLSFLENGGEGVRLRISFLLADMIADILHFVGRDV